MIGVLQFCVKPIWRSNHRRFGFPQWSDALQQVRLPPIHRQQYRLALIRYLRFCKETRQQATVDSASQNVGYTPAGIAEALDRLAALASNNGANPIP